MQPILTVVETSLYVDDLSTAEAFYRDVLGLELLVHEEDRHLFFRVGTRNMLLLFVAHTTLHSDHLPPHGATGAGHVALGIAMEEVDAWRQKLTEHGIHIEQEVDWPRGGHSLYFRDPAGNSLELITPKVWGLPEGW